MGSYFNLPKNAKGIPDGVDHHVDLLPPDDSFGLPPSADGTEELDAFQDRHLRPKMAE